MKEEGKNQQREELIINHKEHKGLLEVHKIFPL